MPKSTIDYSNTVIYKIFCKDENIKSCYIGHTTNFTQRKYQHKLSCDKHNAKIYKTIKENGGWDNWEMIEIACYKCKNSTEARLKEYEHYISENATLNSHSPMEIKEIPIKKVVNQEPKIAASISYNFECDSYDFKCSYKSDWEKHINTTKHKINNGLIKNFVCSCGKSYSTQSNLGKHKKTCLVAKNNVKENNIAENVFVNENNITENDFVNTNTEMNITDFVRYLMKENFELKNILMKQMTQISDIVLKLTHKGYINNDKLNANNVLNNEPNNDNI